MAGLKLYSALAAVMLPFLVLAMAGWARAKTFTVTNTGDSNTPGSGSLRDAINHANSAGGTNNIVFTTGLTGTITLGSTLPLIFNTLTITGPAAFNAAFRGPTRATSPPATRAHSSCRPGVSRCRRTARGSRSRVALPQILT